MSKEQLTPMDVYSSFLVPFDTAAYCRGHRFSPEAVALARAVRNYDTVRAEHASMEQRLEDAQNAIAETLLAVRARMEADPHA